MGRIEITTPKGILLVSGGKLNDQMVKKLNDCLDELQKGEVKAIILGTDCISDGVEDVNIEWIPLSDEDISAMGMRVEVEGKRLSGSIEWIREQLCHPSKK